MTDHCGMPFSSSLMMEVDPAFKARKQRLRTKLATELFIRPRILHFLRDVKIGSLHVKSLARKKKRFRTIAASVCVLL